MLVWNLLKVLVWKDSKLFRSSVWQLGVTAGLPITNYIGHPRLSSIRKEETIILYQVSQPKSETMTTDQNAEEIRKLFKFSDASEDCCGLFRNLRDIPRLFPAALHHKQQFLQKRSSW